MNKQWMALLLSAGMAVTTCYTCSRYITTPEYLEAHKQHLANLEKQLEEGAIYGEHYAEHFIPTIEVLKVIIERLEGLQNGN